MKAKVRKMYEQLQKLVDQCEEKAGIAYDRETDAGEEVGMMWEERQNTLEEALTALGIFGQL